MTNHDDHPPRAWPTKAQVSQYYRARALADQKIGQRLSEALRKPDIRDEVRADIEFWFEFYPECKF